MTVDSVYLFYFFIKNSLYGTYYLYCYLTGTNYNMVEIPAKELEDIRNKMEHQEKVLNELTDLLKKQQISNPESEQSEMKDSN